MTERDYSKLPKAELLAEVEALRKNIERLESSDTLHDLALSEARYRALVEGSSDFIYVLDNDGVFTFANAESGHLLGYDPEEIIGKHFSEILHPDDVEALGRAFHERRTGERAAHRVEVRLRSRAGDTRRVEMDVRHFAITASGLYRGGDYVGTHGVARDITERKYQDDKRVVMQQVREAVWAMVGADDINQVLEAIRRGLETMGVSFEHCAVNVVAMEEPPMLHWYSAYGSSGIAKRGEWMIADTQSYAGTIAAIWRSATPDYRPDLREQDPHEERQRLAEFYGDVRSIIDVPFSFGTLTIANGVANAFTKRDVNLFQELAEALSEGFHRMDDLQQLALSELRYRTLVETPNFVVMLLDSDGKYLYVSPQIEEWLGYSPSDFYSNADIRREIIHPDDLVATEALHQIDQASSLHTMEYRWRHKEGRYLWASGAIFPIYENAEDEQINKVNMMQVVVQDITERKEAEERIRASLAEKEVMLKEIHHRVKNNLQIISSLLNLQAAKLDDHRLLEAFEDSQHRIRSMALIHEELYRSEDLARIDFGGYIRRLTQNLLQSFGLNQSRIDLNIEVDDVMLSIDTAIPLGLIINELVSNSLKYAFPDDRHGDMRIALSAGEDGPFSLVISDDGVGFPEDLDFRNPQSLGLRLVNTLVSQLGSAIELDRSEGAKFTISRD